jgi:hypothetical protein
MQSIIHPADDKSVNVAAEDEKGEQPTAALSPKISPKIPQ